MYIRRITSLRPWWTLFFLLAPGFVKKALLRLRGVQVGKGVVIKIGAVVHIQNPKTASIGDGVIFFPFSFFASKSCAIGAGSRFHPGAVIDVNDYVCGPQTTIMDSATVAGDRVRKAAFHAGVGVKVFPYCWIDCTEGVTLGDYVGIGGFSQIHTHGSWSDYFQGAPVKFGPVTIGNYCWVNWNVTILPGVLPGVLVGDEAVLLSGSVVSKTIASNVICGGSPAKIIGARSEITPKMLQDRVETVIADFRHHFPQYAERIHLATSAQAECLNIYLSTSADDRQSSAMWFDITSSEYQIDDSGLRKAWMKALGWYGVRP